jgi:3-Oxoacyl-[acyl-carrier-protein (ACP)] synthase III C terminal
MVDARAAHLFTRGDLLLLLAFGSGFTWAGALLRYSPFASTPEYRSGRGLGYTGNA